MNARPWLGPLLTVVATLLFVWIARGAVVEAEQLRIAGRSLPDLCPARGWGWRCPGCGLTRSAVLLAQGDAGAAWRAHPGGFVLLGLVLLESSAMLWAPRARRAARWTLAGALVLLSSWHWFAWKT